MDEFEKEVKTDFLFEATQLLNDAEQAFLALEGNKNDPELMNEIFRLAHNLKGTSRAVGFGDVAEFTHEWENLILKIKEGKIEITDSIVSLLLECNDHVSVMIKMLTMDMDSKFDSKEIIAKIHMALEGKYVAENAGSAAETSFVSDEISHEDIPSSDMFVEETIAQEDEAVLHSFENNLHVIGKVEDKEEKAKSFFPSEHKEEMAAAKEVVKEDKKVHEKKGKGPAVEDDNIRVSLSRVEKLNNVVGELVIMQTVLNQHRDEVKNPLMLKSLSQLSKLSKEIQSISMSLRMIPLKQTFQKMQRIVRDTSKALNKKVHLELIDL